MTSSTSYKAVLEQELTILTNELTQIATLNPKSGDWVAIPDPETIGNADSNVEADAVEEWNERRALLVQLEIRYRNITRALQKIADGTFGICEISGNPIEAERLNVNPAARTNLANIEREKELPL